MFQATPMELARLAARLQREGLARWRGAIVAGREHFHPELGVYIPPDAYQVYANPPGKSVRYPAVGLWPHQGAWHVTGYLHNADATTAHPRLADAAVAAIRRLENDGWQPSPPAPPQAADTATPRND